MTADPAEVSLLHLLYLVRTAGGLNQELAYFSFVTLTTVGYGDITPVSPVARSLCVAEALVGQLYPAILIGRLVSLQISSRQDSGHL